VTIAREPVCCECGCAIFDHGAEQSDAWLKSMCGDCHAAEAKALAAYEAEMQVGVDAEDADDRARARWDAEHAGDFLPRGAFL